MNFQDCVALVTGGTSGIGAATALALAGHGAQVYVASRRPPGNDEPKLSSVHFIACDVTEETALEALVDEVQTRAGQLDLAVNAAGYEGEIRPMTDYPVEDCHRVLNVNIVGTLLSLKYELAAMRAAGGGAIVNMASIAGLKGIPNAAAYATSKHAVPGLTRTAALENADVPVRVNAVCPALVDTAMADRLSIKSGLAKPEIAAANPMQRAATPGEVAATICWLLSDAASFISGAAICVDGAQSVA